MKFFNTIYIFTLKPFELLLGFVLDRTFLLTGNAGLSIIGLSFFITIITTPLYYLAERWKSEEKNLQTNMKNDLESISNHYQGQKKFYLTKTAHRLFGYKWYHTLKTSFGLLIQIPFFFAAYNVLSSYTPFYGKSFLCIKNLAQADALFGGVHILPFLMSFINIAYSFYYTRAKTIQENKEQLIMAGVFFVLLYNSPSALLLYWTFNNIFSFIKGVLFRTLNLEHSIVQEKIENPVRLKDFIAEHKGLFLFWIVFVLWGLQVWFLTKYRLAYTKVIIGTGLLSGFATLVILVKKRFRHLFSMVFCWILVVPFFIIAVKGGQNNYFVSNQVIKLSLTLILNSIIFLALLSFIDFSKKWFVFSLKSFFLLLTAYTINIIFLTPLNIYISDPLEISASLKNVILILGLITFIITGCLVILFKVFPKIRKQLFTSLVFLSLSYLMYGLFFNLNVGLFSGFQFHNENAIFNLNLAHFLFDSFIVLVLLVISRIFINHNKILIALSFLLILIPLGNILTSDKEAYKEFNKKNQNTFTMEAAKERHSFSKDHINIVYLILDMFNGNYLQKMIDEDPDLISYLQGFIYYPDTVSPSQCTNASLASLFGGEEYLPLSIYDKNISLRDAQNEAAELFFGTLDAKNFYGLIANPMYIKTKEYEKLSYEDPYAYVPYWRELNGYPINVSNIENIPLLILLSIFQASPWSFRSPMYDRRTWIFYYAIMFKNIQNYAIDNIAYLDFLPKISNTKANTNRFFYYHNNLPHDPFGINSEGNPINKEFSDKENNSLHSGKAAFQAAKKAMHLTINWFKWMQENNVWDNTIVIIISDHGNYAEDTDIDMPQKFNTPQIVYDISRSNSLLMVKPLNNIEPFKTDNRFMMGSDAPMILMQELGFTKDFEIDPRILTNRKRYYNSVVTEGTEIFRKDGVPYRTYLIDGPINEAGSWSIVFE